MKKIKYVLCVLPLVLLAGCGDNNNMEVHIRDGRVTTVVNVEKSSTVGNILNEAELKVTSDDEVIPAVTETVTEPGTEIIISRKNNITITEGGENSINISIMGGTVSDVLSQEGITLGEYDEINHDLQAYLTDGMNIDIVHKIEVELTVDGEKTKVVTSAKTVSELLDEQNVTVGEKDRLSKAVDASLSANDKLVIERVNVKKVTETEPIAYETKTEYSDSMYEGESSVSQEGSDGEKELTYDVTYVDGRESSRKLVSEKVTKEPVNEVITRGTKQRVADSQETGSGRTVVSKQKNYDCDGSGHGWYTITYSDGTVEYEDF